MEEGFVMAADRVFVSIAKVNAFVCPCERRGKSQARAGISRFGRNAHPPRRGFALGIMLRLIEQWNDMWRSVL